MQVYASLDARLPLSEVAAVAQRAEALGYDGIHIPETIHDSFAVALLAAEHTRRITIRTAITLAFVRSPTLVAYNAWDLAAFSGGRFELGLGTQIQQNIEGRYGMPWSAPAPRMREFLETLFAVFDAFETGELEPYEGQAYRVTRLQPYFNPGPNPVTRPPVLLGAVNPRMCRLAGQLADGVITHSTNSDPSYLRDVVRPALEAGAAQAGRTVGRRVPPVIASATLATGPDADAVAEDRERQRRMLAFLYSTPSYGPTLERLDLAGLSEQLRTLTRQDRWEALAEVMTDEVLDRLLISGDFEALPDLLLQRYGDLAAGIVMPLPSDDSADLRLAGAIARLRAG